MTAHKHAEMIKAKADNMELVVFVKYKYNRYWQLSSYKELICMQENEFFLCLPRHKEACLHWLNGGEIQVLNGNSWDDCVPRLGENQTWFIDGFLMNNGCDYRIKPRKEKRWIGYHKYRHTTTKAYATKDDAKSDTVDHDKWQFIEIEVEV